MKLSQAWSAYEADKRLLGYSKYTLKAYKIQSDLLIRHFGDMEIKEVKTEHLKAYLLEAAKHLKPSSVNHRQRFIRSLFHWARAEGYIDKNPAEKLREMKEGQRIPKALPEEDMEMLREGCRTAREHALVEVLFTTGCRIGEVYRLNRNAIDWTTRSMIVLGKGDKEREVCFTVKAAIWLKKYLSERKDDDMALFVTERDPHRLSIERMREILKEIAKRAEIQNNVYPHKLRHTYAVHLLNNGAPMEAIQNLMGHGKIETTQLYAQLSGERRRELYRRYF
jgi:integrase/recombinase XerD